MFSGREGRIFVGSAARDDPGTGTYMVDPSYLSILELEEMSSRTAKCSSKMV